MKVVKILLLIFVSNIVLAENTVQIRDSSNFYKLMYTDEYIQIKSQFLNDKVEKRPCNEQSQKEFIKTLNKFLSVKSKDRSELVGAQIQKETVEVIYNSKALKFPRSSEAGTFFSEIPDSFLKIKLASQLGCRKVKK